MEKTLILTGWSKTVYMTAAAAALEALKWKADVAGVSIGQQYSQVGYVKPDADGFVTIKAGLLTVVVYKTQVWYQKMPGEAPKDK